MKKKNNLNININPTMKKIVLVIIAAIAIFFPNLLSNNQRKMLEQEILNAPVSTSTAVVEQSNLYDVVRVIDGDTFIINYEGNDERVRLLGVDTPESVHPQKEKNTEEGKIASDFTKNYLQGKRVSLEFDTEPRDRYNRILAYVYVDGKMFNKLLLEKGYAHVMIVGKNRKYANEFKAIEEKARNNKVGFWSGTVFENKK